MKNNKNKCNAPYINYYPDHAIIICLFVYDDKGEILNISTSHRKQFKVYKVTILVDCVKILSETLQHCGEVV